MTVKFLTVVFRLISSAEWELEPLLQPTGWRVSLQAVQALRSFARFRLVALMGSRLLLARKQDPV